MNCKAEKENRASNPGKYQGYFQVSGSVWGGEGKATSANLEKTTS
jgi:hypothetical protein